MGEDHSEQPSTGAEIDELRDEMEEQQNELRDLLGGNSDDEAPAEDGSDSDSGDGDDMDASEDRR